MLKGSTTQLDKLTTQADSFFTELECEGQIDNQIALLNFLDELVDFLEGMGGQVDTMKYLDNRHLNLRQRAQFGMMIHRNLLNKENTKEVM